MSLRAFHIFFIAVAILFCAGCCVVELGTYTETHRKESLYIALTAAASCLGLVIYFIYFLRKIRNSTNP